MCDRLTFCGPRGTIQLSLPSDLAGQIAGWTAVRKAMLKEVPPEFARDEWAYLVSFLDEQNLMRSLHQSFGALTDKLEHPTLLARPLGSVAIWLPNNVSLLGPLMLVLTSLTGNRLRMKAGSRSADLAGIFLQFARKHAAGGSLARYLQGKVFHESFSFDDARNRAMAEDSAVRIVFGSNEAAAAIHALPHRADSIGISFTDRRSEAWVEPDCCDDKTLRDLIKVFAIYGQAGCTSPSRVILMNSTRREALTIRDRLVALWPGVSRRRPEMHLASDNLQACQLARAAGWDSILVEGNRAVVSVGDYSLPTFPGLMELRIIPATPEDAFIALPENTQTVGHVLRDPAAPEWLDRVTATKIARFVPLATMHHFETIWDGQDFFAQLFTYTRVSL